MYDDLLEPESESVPTHKERSELVYKALRKRLDKGQLGQCNFAFDKVEIEGLMGLLSHRFEGCF